MPRRKSSSFYSVDGKDGAKKSPFVLDLRKYSKDKQAGMQKVNESPVIERLKRSAERYGASPKPLVRGRRDSSIFSDDDLTRDAILGELDKFENYETELASIISVPEGERPEVEYPQVRKPPLRLIPERRNKYKEDEKNTYPSEQAILSYFEKKNSEPLAEQYTDDKYLQEISQDPDFHESLYEPRNRGCGDCPRARGPCQRWPAPPGGGERNGFGPVEKRPADV